MKLIPALLTIALAATPVWAQTVTRRTTTTITETVTVESNESKFSWNNCRQAFYAVGYFEQFNQMCFGRLLPMTDDEKVVDAVALECINLFSRPTANPTLRRGRADMRVQAAENGLECRQAYLPE